VDAIAPRNERLRVMPGSIGYPPHARARMPPLPSPPPGWPRRASECGTVMRRAACTEASWTD